MEEMVQTGVDIVVLTASMEERPERIVDICSGAQVPFHVFHQQPNVGVVPAYHELWKAHWDEAIQIYIHDDVSICDRNWLERVCLELMDPKVAIVGLGGATGMGSSDIYKVPYDMDQLARTGYYSNQEDWETHGFLETREHKVAVVDGFFMAVKGEFLREVNGWSWIKSNFHCYDTAMCLEAIRRGWEARMAGVLCRHHGGGTSTKPEYAEWCREHATTMEEEHRQPHLWLYEEYRDLLPVRIS